MGLMPHVFHICILSNTITPPNSEVKVGVPAFSSKIERVLFNYVLRHRIDQNWHHEQRLFGYNWSLSNTWAYNKWLQSCHVHIYDAITDQSTTITLIFHNIRFHSEEKKTGWVTWHPLAYVSLSNFRLQWENFTFKVQSNRKFKFDIWNQLDPFTTNQLTTTSVLKHFWYAF